MNKHRTNALLQLLVLFALAAAVVLALAWPQLPFARRESEPAATEAAAAAKEKLDLSPALYGVGSTGAIAAALERSSLAASAVWSDFAAEGAVRTARGEDWQPQPLAFSVLRGEDIYEPDNHKLLFPVAS